MVSLHFFPLKFAKYVKMYFIHPILRDIKVMNCLHKMFYLSNIEAHNEWSYYIYLLSSLKKNVNANYSSNIYDPKVNEWCHLKKN